MGFLEKGFSNYRTENIILKSANLIKAVLYRVLATSNMAVGNGDKLLLLKAGLGSVSITHSSFITAPDSVSIATKPPLSKYFPLIQLCVFLYSCFFPLFFLSIFL